MSTVLPTVHWPMVINELVRVTRPSGWIELMEYGSYVSGGPTTLNCSQYSRFPPSPDGRQELRSAVSPFTN
jgi:hypothetical protein